jgi:hypothetical protein
MIATHEQLDVPSAKTCIRAGSECLKLATANVSERALQNSLVLPLSSRSWPARGGTSARLPGTERLGDASGDDAFAVAGRGEGEAAATSQCMTMASELCVGDPLSRLQASCMQPALRQIGERVCAEPHLRLGSAHSHRITSLR